MARRINKNDKISNVKSVESIAEVFQCIICIQKIHDAHMCPECSKLFCFTCIRRWLTQQHSDCPHCRTSLHLRMLIKCRWAEEVTEQLNILQTATTSLLQNDNSKRCVKHQANLSIYCDFCHRCICYVCAIWDDTHHGHDFKPLEEVCKQRVTHLKDKITLIRRRHSDLDILVKDVQRNIENVTVAKFEKEREIFKVTELMIARLDSHLDAKLSTLMKQETILTDEMEQIENIVQDAEYYLLSCTSAEFISQSDELSHNILQIQKKPIDSFITAPISADFQSEIVPPYDSSTFILQPFSELRHKNNPVYSTPLYVNGFSWRLKVYPNGHGLAKGKHLTVFLELSVGVPEISKYEYRVEMIHQSSRDPSKNYVRDSVSDFAIGECWGFDRFYSLNLLATAGYLDITTDTLQLNFYVRPPTFFQRCRDQQWYIDKHIRDIQKPMTVISQYNKQINHISSSDVESIQNDLMSIVDLTYPNLGEALPLSSPHSCIISENQTDHGVFSVTSRNESCTSLRADTSFQSRADNFRSSSESDNVTADENRKNNSNILYVEVKFDENAISDESIYHSDTEGSWADDETSYHDILEENSL